MSRPHGFNVGLNLGTSAGGSLAEHLHMHVVPRWGGDANFITIIGGSKVIPQLLRDTRELLADRVGRTAVSDFYLMTRAAYAKLSRPVAKAALRVGLTPDSITIIGTAGTVHRGADAVPDRPAVVGRVRGRSFFVLADMLDGAMARERGGGTRVRRRCWTPPATGSATARSSAGCCGGPRSACTAPRWWSPR